MRAFFALAFSFTVSLGMCGTSFAETLDDAEVPESYAVSDVDDVVIGEVYNDDCIGTWLDNTSIWIGGDVYKSVGDRLTNINGGTGSLTSSFGNVAGFNTGFGLGASKIRGQIGGSYGYYDYKGRIALVPRAMEPEQQAFVTAGVYKRGDITGDCDPISWGVVYDYFYAENWGINGNNFDLGQFRGIVGYALNECTEVGVWGTAHADDTLAAVTVAGVPGVRRPIRAMNQANAYVRHNFGYGSEVMFYAGVLDHADIGDWQFGLNGITPMNCNWSLYGNFNYVVPSAPSGPSGSGEEQFSVGFGLVYSFGGKAIRPSVTGQPGMPLLNVANNGSFLITD